MTSLPEIPLPPKIKKNVSKPKILFYIGQTKYPVVKYVGQKLLNYKLTDNAEDPWDVMWTDSAVTPDLFDKMKPYQKVNHFPGMYSLARKNHLGRHLMKMRQKFPEYYRFFPKTFLLPADYSLFKAHFLEKKLCKKTFIVKPEASCQGRGIYLTRNYENVDPMDHVVIQNYIEKPFLIDGLKFDLRIYVLLAGCDPLRIYIHKEGLARFATEEYHPPSNGNIENLCMHLTNYAINKKNKNFVFNKDQAKSSEGHKRSLSALFSSLEAKGHDTALLMHKIERMIVKMFCSVQPILAHNYSSCQPQSLKNDMCFEILGLDILLDHKLTPYLIEVNHTPSFNTDTPLDKAVKRAVIKDSLVLMNIKKSHKVKYLKEQKAQFEKRAFAGNKAKLTFEEKEKIIQKNLVQRDLYEQQNLGGFKKLYPLETEEEPYKEFIEYAKVLWQKATGTLKKAESVEETPQILMKKEAGIKEKLKNDEKIIKIKSPGFNRSQSQNSTKTGNSLQMQSQQGAFKKEEVKIINRPQNVNVVKLVKMKSQQKFVLSDFNNNIASNKNNNVNTNLIIEKNLTNSNNNVLKNGQFIRAKVMEFFPNGVLKLNNK